MSIRCSSAYAGVRLELLLVRAETRPACTESNDHVCTSAARRPVTAGAHLRIHTGRARCGRAVSAWPTDRLAWRPYDQALGRPLPSRRSWQWSAPPSAAAVPPWPPRCPPTGLSPGQLYSTVYTLGDTQGFVVIN